MSVLDEILDGVRADLAERQQTVYRWTSSSERAARAPAPRDAYAALGGDRVSVIAEVKRSSPSKGRAGRDRRPGRARRRLRGGRRPRHQRADRAAPFGGSLDDLAAVRAGVDVPVLRKDFIVTSYQLWEARAYGADLALLIVAALDQNALVSLIERAESIGLTPLVEVHTEEELDRALDAGRRDHRGQRARPQDPRGRPRGVRQARARRSPTGSIKIAESGVRGPHDLLAYATGRRRRRPGRREPGHRQGPAAAVADLVDRRAPTRRRAPTTEDSRDSSDRDEGTVLTAADLAGNGVHGDDPDVHGKFGVFGGRLVPEALIPALDEVAAGLRARPRTTRRSCASSTTCCAPTPGRPTTLTEVPRGSPSTRAAPGSCSSARTSPTPAPTRSTTCSARRCSPSGWARPG